MEDFKWIIYVLIAVYLIFRSRKKKSSPPDNDYKPFNTDSQPSTKPVTFEDLLKEIQQSKTTKPEVKKFPAKPVYEKPQYVDYDDDIKSEEEDLEDVNYNNRSESEIYETYEKAKKEAFNKPTYEDSPVDLEGSVVRFKHFKEYDNLSVPSEAQNIAKELQNPDNIKRAIVLSEVLNRRY
jgi:hypothetical protein